MEVIKECLICYSPMSEESRVIFEDCGHDFCMSCAKEWIFENTNCPIDRIETNTLRVVKGTKSYLMRRGDFDDFVCLSKVLIEINFISTILSNMSEIRTVIPVNIEKTDELKETLNNFGNSYEKIWKSLQFPELMVSCNYCDIFFRVSQRVNWVNLLDEFEILFYNINLLIERKSIFLKDISSNTDICVDLLNKKQTVVYSEKLQEHLEYSTNLFQLFLKRTFIFFKSLMTKEMDYFFPILTTQQDQLDFISPGIPVKNIQVQNRLIELEFLIFENLYAGRSEYYQKFQIAVTSLEYLLESINSVSKAAGLKNISAFEKEILRNELAYYDAKLHLEDKEPFEPDHNLNELIKVVSDLIGNISYLITECYTMESVECIKSECKANLKAIKFRCIKIKIGEESWHFLYLLKQLYSILGEF